MKPPGADLVKKLAGWQVWTTQNRGSWEGRNERDWYVIWAEKDGRMIRVIYERLDSGKPWKRRSGWVYTPAAQVTWTAASDAAVKTYIDVRQA